VGLGTQLTEKPITVMPNPPCPTIQTNRSPKPPIYPTSLACDRGENWIVFFIGFKVNIKL